MWSRTSRAWRARCARRDVSSSAASGVEVGLERRLRVDDDALAAGQLDDEVGPEQPSLVVALARLLDEVAVREHAGQLDDALELHLAPAAADVRRAQRGDEVAGLLAQALLALGDGPEQLVDRADLRRAASASSACACSSKRSSVSLIGRASPPSVASSDDELVRERVAGERLEVLLPLAWVRSTSASLSLGGGRSPPRAQIQTSEARRATASPQIAAMAASHEPANGTRRRRTAITGSAVRPYEQLEIAYGQKKSAPASPKTYRS